MCCPFYCPRPRPTAWPAEQGAFQRQCVQHLKTNRCMQNFLKAAEPDRSLEPEEGGGLIGGRVSSGEGPPAVHSRSKVPRPRPHCHWRGLIAWATPAHWTERDADRHMGGGVSHGHRRGGGGGLAGGGGRSSTFSRPRPRSSSRDRGPRPVRRGQGGGNPGYPNTYTFTTRWSFRAMCHGETVLQLFFVPAALRPDF